MNHSKHGAECTTMIWHNAQGASREHAHMHARTHVQQPQPQLQRPQQRPRLRRRRPPTIDRPTVLLLVLVYWGGGLLTIGGRSTHTRMHTHNVRARPTARGQPTPATAKSQSPSPTAPTDAKPQAKHQAPTAKRAESRASTEEWARRRLALGLLTCGGVVGGGQGGSVSSTPRVT